MREETKTRRQREAEQKEGATKTSALAQKDTVGSGVLFRVYSVRDWVGQRSGRLMDGCVRIEACFSPCGPVSFGLFGALVVVFFLFGVCAGGGWLFGLWQDGDFVSFLVVRSCLCQWVERPVLPLQCQTRLETIHGRAQTDRGKEQARERPK